MSTFENETMTALATLFAKMHALSALNIRDLLLPEKYQEFRATLDTAYDALVQVEDSLDSLGMKLEYHHWRIESAFEEIKPLSLKLPQSRADEAVEAFERELQRWEQHHPLS